MGATGSGSCQQKCVPPCCERWVAPKAEYCELEKYPHVNSQHVLPDAYDIYVKPSKLRPGPAPPIAENTEKHSLMERENTETRLTREHGEKHSWTVPIQFPGTEHGLKRPRDGQDLKTDFQSLIDVDGDGVEVGELLSAVLMMPPSADSMDAPSAGGQLLYRDPNLYHGPQGSAVEVSLREDMRELKEHVDRVHSEVTSYRKDLEKGGGRDTQVYLQTEAASLAVSAARLAADCMSDADKQTSIQLRVFHHL
eukprot:gnl/MRDRNA2_/MRDRNA2_80928_c0_seq1.p1 gnl/MRDRNA2_/MRDRNA2_80928_c0~~gnl/MRDRNA2_/MRDRNA2_80928_c0_seq1.p1  ORF type:complete len:252 (+),score=44.95 gnl/MRDRNA2_/MRDRNA2_80928_c0_seq1:138-893(+)